MPLELLDPETLTKQRTSLHLWSSRGDWKLEAVLAAVAWEGSLGTKDTGLDNQ